MIVTDQADWGGWRVPGAEYDRDPRKIEAQARVIHAAPQLLALARELAESVEEHEDAPAEAVRLAQVARKILRSIVAQPAPPAAADPAPTQELSAA